MAEKEINPKLIPEINIGMVGHVDHGKTSLTSTLTGKWTDTHSEEIKRGITIRLGYADATIYKCPKCKEPECYGTTDKCMKCFSQCRPVRTVSFVDAPGHETLMATVLSGASLMDGAILVISANEPCPQPQTREHLTALDIVGIKNIVVVQNKIDIVSKEDALKSYREIKEFLKGSVAENAPIIPVSAQQRINMDVLVKVVEETIPTPKRDPSKDPLVYVARTFDVNKPGTPVEKLRGGVVGGSLIRGQLKVGQEVEIRPGVKMKDKFEPVTTRVTGLQKAMKDLKTVGPGGLLGISTELDPYLSKSDMLSGNVLGLPGKLPPVWESVTLKTSLLSRVVGSKEELRVDPIKTGDPLMLTVGTSRTIGVVASARPGTAQMNLKIPICTDKGSRIALSRQVAGRWRLIGWGEIV
jgi:translation initiation factor 2 subunit 3